MKPVRVHTCCVLDAGEFYPGIQVWYPKWFARKAHLSKFQHLRLVGTWLARINGVDQVLVDLGRRQLIVIPIGATTNTGIELDGLIVLTWQIERELARLLQTTSRPASWLGQPALSWPGAGTRVVNGRNEE